MQLPKELEHLVDGPLDEDVVDQMTDEELHWGTLLLLNGCSFRRVALFARSTKHDYESRASDLRRAGRRRENEATW